VELPLVAVLALALLLAWTATPRPAARRVRADHRVGGARRRRDGDEPAVELHDFRDDEPVWHERPVVVGTALAVSGLLVAAATVAALVDL
jgi:hypothetical protein